MAYEKWKDIKGYEGLYAISSYGRVFISERTIKDNSGRIRKLKGKIAKQSTSSNGYSFVGLTKNNERKIHYIHKIVSEHFLKRKLNKKWVNHIDGDKKNNNVINLEFCTPSENIKHAYDNNLNVHFKGVGFPLSKLDDDKVKEIRILYSTNCKNRKQLADKYNVSVGAIAKVINNETWKHVK